MTDLNDLALPDLFSRLAAAGDLAGLLARVRDEDLGPEGIDRTCAVAFDGRARLRAAVRAREGGVLAGLAALPALVEAYGGRVECSQVATDGERCEPGDRVAVLRGPAPDVLAVERPLLNLLGRLSGVATRTSRFVGAIGEGLPARLFDTRKTTPGLRHLEKYAVRCGGGFCHRLGLHDAIMFKDNHLASFGSGPLARRVLAAATAARERWPGALSFIEVEVDTLDQFRDLLGLPTGAIDHVLLDNMPVDDMREAVAMKRDRQPGWRLEASGGVTLETIGLVASTMVERISVGSLTHHAVSLDFGLDAE